MKIEGALFAMGTAFFLLLSGIYWYFARDPIGTTALVMSGALAFLVAFYLLYTSKRVFPRPEDRPDANIDEADPEYGFFSPHSWWPLPVAVAATGAGLGLIIGWWLTLIAVGALLISVLGFVLQYERPSNSPHH